MIMPKSRLKSLSWGAYRGVPIEEVPRSYLYWILERVDLSPADRELVCDRLGESPGDWPNRDELRREVLRWKRLCPGGQPQSPGRTAARLFRPRPGGQQLDCDSANRPGRGNCR